MIESPLIQELVAERLREALLDVLKGKFGKVPSDVRRLLTEVKKQKALERLFVRAGRAESVEEFKEHLLE